MSDGLYYKDGKKVKYSPPSTHSVRERRTIFMLKIAVCDDDRQDMERLESAFDEIKLSGISYDVYFSAQELLKYQQRHNETYNLYILDIEMPTTSGLELAKQIRQKDSRALFVFLTSYTEYAMDVFELITFDYIAKPIDSRRLNAVLEKAMNYLNMMRRDFVFQFRKNHFRIGCDDILYIEKNGRQAFIHTVPKTYKANMNMGEIWNQLDKRCFAHIHVSFIVNLQHVKAIERDEVVLDDGVRLLIARTQKQTFKEKHMLFLKGMV